MLFTLSNFWWIYSGRILKNPKGLYQSTSKEKENWCHLFSSSNKRKILIRYFHVVVVQRWLRNLQNSMAHVQSCCVANLNLFDTCTSPIMHLICPPKFCISIVFYFPWDGCNTQEKWKSKVMQSLGGKQGVIWEMCKWRIAFFEKTLSLRSSLLLLLLFKLGYFHSW